MAGLKQRLKLYRVELATAGLTICLILSPLAAVHLQLPRLEDIAVWTLICCVALGLCVQIYFWVFRAVVFLLYLFGNVEALDRILRYEREP
jgi:hypothetical protein